MTRTIIFEKIKKEITKQDLIRAFKKALIGCDNYEKITFHTYGCSVSYMIFTTTGRYELQSINISNRNQQKIYFLERTISLFDTNINTIEYEHLFDFAKNIKHKLFETKFREDKKNELIEFLNT